MPNPNEEAAETCLMRSLELSRQQGAIGVGASRDR